MPFFGSFPSSIILAQCCISKSCQSVENQRFSHVLRVYRNAIPPENVKKKTLSGAFGGHRYIQHWAKTGENN